MSKTQTSARPRPKAARKSGATRSRGHSGAADRARLPHFPLPAVLDPDGLDAVDADDRRLLRPQIRLGPGVFAAVRRPVQRPDPRTAAAARRRRRVPATPRQPDDYIKRDRRPARRPHPDERALLYINGEPVGTRSVRLDDSTSTTALAAGRSAATSRDAATAVSYPVLDPGDSTTRSTTPPVYVVPAGHVFMMGDNRDHSADSRVLSPRSASCRSTTSSARPRLIFFSIKGSAAVADLAVAGQCPLGRACSTGVSSYPGGVIRRSETRSLGSAGSDLPFAEPALLDAR